MGGFLKVVVGYPKVVVGFLNVYQKVYEPKNLIAKKEFLNVKIKPSRNVNKTFTQRFHKIFFC